MDARGRVCPKHNEFSPTGECRWCEPAQAIADWALTLSRGGEVPHGPHKPAGSGSNPDPATKTSSYFTLGDPGLKSGMEAATFKGIDLSAIRVDWTQVGLCPIGKHKASQSHKCALCGASGEQILAQAFA